MRNFSLNSLNEKKGCKTKKNINNKNMVIKHRLLSKNKEMISVQQIINRTKKK